MQNTRFNTLVDSAGNQLTQFFQNPWRRLSLLVISLLFGIFLGTAIPTAAGQTAEWDIVGAGILVLITEVISRGIYGRYRGSIRPLPADLLNMLKVGLTYGMFIEAFKISS